MKIRCHISQPNTGYPRDPFTQNVLGNRLLGLHSWEDRGWECVNVGQQFLILFCWIVARRKGEVAWCQRGVVPHLTSTILTKCFKCQVSIVIYFCWIVWRQWWGCVINVSHLKVSQQHATEPLTAWLKREEIGQQKRLDTPFKQVHTIGIGHTDTQVFSLCNQPSPSLPSILGTIVARW